MPTLTIQAAFDGEHVLSTTIAAADVAHALTTADEIMASMGTPRDALWAWTKRALEVRSYIGDRTLSEQLLATLLWLACREPYTGEEMEEVVRQGGLLECLLREDRAEGLFIVTPAVEMIGASPRSGAKH